MKASTVFLTLYSPRVITWWFSSHCLLFVCLLLTLTGSSSSHLPITRFLYLRFEGFVHQVQGRGAGLCT